MVNFHHLNCTALIASHRFGRDNSVADKLSLSDLQLFHHLPMLAARTTPVTLTRLAQVPIV